jgi:enolase
MITSIVAREVLDSRGDPTVEVEIEACDGVDAGIGVAIAPSGASSGSAEAHVLRDGDAARYDGRGVRKAVSQIESLVAPALRGFPELDQAGVDKLLIELDGTPNKSRLGGNAIVAVSLAVAHAAAACAREPLFRYFARLAGETDSLQAVRMPRIMTNMISGGLHAGHNLDFQDVLAIPHGAADTAEAIEWLVRIYKRLGELLAKAGYEGRLVGDEGGYGPKLASSRQAIEFVVRAIESAKLRPGEDVSLALDVAASHFHDGEFYRLAEQGKRPWQAEEMIGLLAGLVHDFPIVSIEDGLAEEDWPGWKALTARLGSRVAIVGDDLFATNPVRIDRGVRELSANAALIKFNQVGTLTETLHAMRLAKEAGWQRIVSARSGETEDSTIADLAVATAADYIKIGAIVRGERTVKYNRLLRIAGES